MPEKKNTRSLVAAAVWLIYVICLVMGMLILLSLQVVGIVHIDLAWWLVMLLSIPASYAIVALMFGRKRGKAVNMTAHPPTMVLNVQNTAEPQYGEMKEQWGDAR